MEQVGKDEERDRGPLQCYHGNRVDTITIQPAVVYISHLPTHSAFVHIPSDGHHVCTCSGSDDNEHGLNLDATAQSKCGPGFLWLRHTCFGVVNEFMAQGKHTPKPEHYISI